MFLLSILFFLFMVASNLLFVKYFYTINIFFTNKVWCLRYEGVELLRGMAVFRRRERKCKVRERDSPIE